MSVRIAIIPFRGASTYDVHVVASADGVELAMTDENNSKPFQLPALSSTAARMLSDALRNAADEADAIIRDANDEKFEQRGKDIETLIEIAKAASPNMEMPLPKTPKASS